MKKRLDIFAVALILITIIFLILFYYEIFLVKKEIKIGFLGDLSNDRLSKDALVGIQIAAKEINSISTDNKIKLVVYDTKNKTELIQNYFYKLANEDKVMAIITTHIEEQEIPETLKVPTIFIDDDKLKAERGDNFYWVMELSHLISDSIYHTIRRLKNNINMGNAVIITSNTQSSETYGYAMENILPLFNISSLGSFNLDDDSSALVLKIKELNPDMVILSTNTENAINFLKESKNKNLNPKIYFTSFEVSTLTLQANYKDLPNPVYVHTYLTAIRRAKVIKPNSFMLFDREIAIRTGGAPTSSVSLNAYDAMNLLHYTIQKGPNVLNTPQSLQKDRVDLMKALWATRGYVSARGLLFPDGKTGFLRRNFYRIEVINNGKTSLLIGS